MLCLNGRADATEVKTTLEESYPKLKEGGGFEILRRGPSPSELTLIPPPPSGYTVKFLRDSAGLGQAIAFVRPLQCNLNREAIKPVSAMWVITELYYIYLGYFLKATEDWQGR